MERFLLFCKVSALVFMIPLTISDKLSLRSGQEDTDKLTNCTMCPRIYKPVCASNGKWYHSSCFMACEVGNDTSINILYEGLCKPEHTHIDNDAEESTPSSKCVERCPKENSPVCGVNGKWYPNRCLLACDRMPRVHDGLCPSTPSTPLAPLPPPEPITAPFETPFKNCPTCTKVYDPVCVSNRNWYYNPCVMECVLGECSPEHMRPHPEDPNLPPKECVESCPKDNMPMCGANGKWYLNMCFLDCDRVAIGAIQLCPPTSPMPSMPLVPTPSTPLVHDPILAQFEKPLNDNCPTCTKVYDPVCLSNGRWYFNTCVMECVLGERQYQYAILYHGKCISF